jgi:outer membrane receptor protein involved in Fe transport
MDFVDNQELGADVNLDYYNNSDSLTKQGSSLLNLRPYICLDFNDLKILLGLKGTMETDSGTAFHLYPEVKLSYQVVPDYLSFYIGVSGGLERNSLRSVSDVNPWINPVFPLGFTNTKYQIKGGFAGKLDNVLDYNFSVAYSDIENMLFYVNIFSDPLNSAILVVPGNKFTGVYDNVQLTTVKTEIAWQQSYNLAFSFAAEYDNYKMTSELKPWHEPAFTSKIGVKYQLTPKITVSAQLYYRSKVYAKLFESNPQQFTDIKAIIDLSLGAEYRFNDRISAFVRINNLTGTRYYRWYNYPSQGLNAMAGLTFSF